MAPKEEKAAKVLGPHHNARVVSDLLASHWADDHHLPGWRDPAAEARDRLWRRHTDLLEKLGEVGGPYDRAD